MIQCEDMGMGSEWHYTMRDISFLETWFRALMPCLHTIIPKLCKAILNTYQGSWYFLYLTCRFTIYHFKTYDANSFVIHWLCVTRVTWVPMSTSSESKTMAIKQMKSMVELLFLHIHHIWLIQTYILLHRCINQKDNAFVTIWYLVW